MAKIQAIRGMNDVLPETSGYWQYLEDQFRQTLSQYGYTEIRMPLLEKTALFKRGIGDVTDIVEKEMYTFEDRNGDSLSLRPEGTASCVRACMEHGLIHNQVRRLYYIGQMYRHERPQKGRYRQFNQLGVETFGLAGPDIDAEVVAMTARLWQRLGLQDSVTLQINSLGTSDERISYRAVLVDYFTDHKDALDDDSIRRLASNPLRILDSKNPDLKDLITQAPKMVDHLGEESRAHFEGFCQRLNALGIKYDVNPALVRGLDYYTHMVFEWVTADLGAQGTVCAGGRYDGLVEQFGGHSTPAVGFALGIERLLLLLEAKSLLPESKSIDLYCMPAGDNASVAMMALVEKIRTETQLNSVLHCAGGGFKSMFKKADKSGAPLALILGEDELAKGLVVIKYLREDKPQETIAQSEVVNWLKDWRG